MQVMQMFSSQRYLPHGPARAAAFAELNRKYPAAAATRGGFARQADDSVDLESSDMSGEVRARLVVRPTGEPALEFLSRAKAKSFGRSPAWRESRADARGELSMCGMF